VKSYNCLGLGEFFAWVLTAELKILILRFMYVVVIIIAVYFAITTLIAAKDKVLAISQFIPVVFLLSARIVDFFYWIKNFSSSLELLANFQNRPCCCFVEFCSYLFTDNL